MPYCPRCRYELEENIETCPDCNVDLVAELLPIPEEYEDAEWVELYAFPGTLYARMAIELLRRETIPAYSQSYFGGTGMGVGDVGDFVSARAAVYVLEPDLERSRDIIGAMIDEIPGAGEEDAEADAE